MRVIKMKTINLFFCIFIVLFFIMLFMTIVYKKIVNEEEIVQTVATPISNKVVVIDSGHGGEDGRSNF